MPVYNPWIEYCDNKLILHDDGTGMYRRFSNKYFDLLSDKNELSLNILNESWNIDLWISILATLKINNYDVNMINLLSGLFIEIIRTRSICVHDTDRDKLYNEIREIIKIIYDYMISENIKSMNYKYYSKWPIEVKQAMNKLTEGKVEFYRATANHHVINIHQLDFTDDYEKCIKYISTLVINAPTKPGKLFDLILDEDLIIKLIYNMHEYKSITLKFITISEFMGKTVQKIYNKIEILSMIYKSIIQIEECSVSGITKLKSFCRLWNIFKDYTADICTPYTDKIDTDTNNKVLFISLERSQTNIRDLLQVLGFDLLTSIKNSLEDFLELKDLLILEDFMNTPLNFKRYEIVEHLDENGNLWFKYLKGDTKQIPFKFNYTPMLKMIDYELRLENLPKQLMFNDGIDIFKELIKNN
jgi:hypothetical protein